MIAPMDKALCCTPSGADVPALKALWQTVFGDTPGFIHRFFDRWYDPALTAVVKTGGAVAAMAYVLPTGRYLTPASAIPAAMIYAVACDPRHRGRGFGRAVTEHACSLALAAGYEAVTLSPAEKSLFGFYAALGFSTGFYVREETVPAATPGDALALTPVSDEAYYALRERLLADVPHMEITPSYLALQRLLCQDGGGMAAMTEQGAPVGCMIWEREGETVSVKEYLCPLPPAQAAGLLGCDRASFCLPGGDGDAPFAMFWGKPCGGYYGLAFG